MSAYFWARLIKQTEADMLCSWAKRQITPGQLAIRSGAAENANSLGLVVALFALVGVEGGRGSGKSL
jgi:hypothetical protein